MKKVYIYGDSILKGILLNKETKRYYTMKNTIKELEKYFPFKIENKSKFGRTIDRDIRK